MTTAPRRDRYDVVVIGAGPAGLAAAATSAKAGLSTLLLDENVGPGGQVWRAIASTPVIERDCLGADYWAGGDLVEEMRASGASHTAYKLPSSGSQPTSRKRLSSVPSGLATTTSTES